MDRTERFYKIDQLLREHRLVPLSVFLSELQVSRATFKRDLEYLRDRLNAPIEWDRELGGYVLSQVSVEGPKYALPGVWFSAGEIQALLSVQQVFGALQQGWMKDQLAPLQARLWAMLGEKGYAPAMLEARIRVMTPAMRAVEPACFATACQAVLMRQQLQIEYFHRARNEVQTREISPQRLVHYRGNWYVDAWCHLRSDLRSFALDAIRSAAQLHTPAIDIAGHELDQHLAAGYGIFSGADVQWAHLCFSPSRTRWVAAEEWHPQQRSELDEHGCLHLHLPYSDTRELLMDILRHGADIEVLAPVDLREAVHSAARAMVERHAGPSGSMQK